MDTIKEVVCPVCGAKGEIRGRKVNAEQGMLEDFPGYTTASFHCQSCGLEMSGQVGNEEDPVAEQVEALAQDLEDFGNERRDFRTTEKLKTIGALLLRKIGDYDATLEEVQGWLKKHG